jgi:hypothetical protein
MDAFADLTCGGALKFGIADAEAMALFRRRASGTGAGALGRGVEEGPTGGTHAQPSAAQNSRCFSPSLSSPFPGPAAPAIPDLKLTATKDPVEVREHRGEMRER